MKDDEGEKPVGYRQPPLSTRFQKGRSGNAKGRPRGRTNVGIPYESVLGQLVSIREDGTEKQVTAAEAFLLHLAKQGLEGKPAAIKGALSAIEQGQSAGQRQETVFKIIREIVAPGNPNHALIPLRMAKKLDRFLPTARTMLEPWLVEEALAKLGEKRLTPEQQLTVLKATLTPHKVNWPHWWTVKSESA